MKYTKEDVIMCESKAKELGLERCMQIYGGNSPTVCVEHANDDDHSIHLVAINFKKNRPFLDNIGNWWECVIIKKEPEVKYIPYDLSKKEDRDELMGKKIKWSSSDGAYAEEIITAIYTGVKTNYWLANNKESKVLLDLWKFVDTGKPVGKPVTEEEEG